MSRFPIGIYGVDDPKYLARLKADGFDSFQTYRTDWNLLERLAKESQRVGMRMVVFPDEALSRDVARTREWPVDAWYLKGEPETTHFSSAALQGLSDRARAWDAATPQAFDIGIGTAAAVYGAVGDIILMDWYPVPHMPTDSVADQADAVVGSIPPGKPFWMIVQAYDWADAMPEAIALRKRLRFPTHAEIRFMSYLAVMHGARGLFYFALPKKGKTLFDYPELWQAVSRVALEIRSMRPVFERGRIAPLPFPPEPDGPEARCWTYRGRRYVVLANRSKDFDLRVPDQLLETEWRPLFEARRDAREVLDQRPGGFYLPPYRAMVFESRWHWSL